MFDKIFTPQVKKRIYIAFFVVLFLQVLGFLLFVWLNNQKKINRPQKETGAAETLVRSSDPVLGINTDSQIEQAAPSRMDSLKKPTEKKGVKSTSVMDNTALTKETNGTVEPIRRYTEGPYKGMTYEEAQEHYQWLTRKNELDQRLIELSEKELSLTTLLLKSADDELSTMLSLFKLMSPEQLEFVRQDLLKNFDAEKVESFFSDLSNASTKTPEQIVSASQEILTAREAYKIVRRELDAEDAQLQQELREFYGPEYDEKNEKRAEELKEMLRESGSILADLF